MKCQHQHKLLIHMICHSFRVHRPSLCILPSCHVVRPVTWINTPLKEAQCYYFSNHRHRMSQIFLYPSNHNSSSSNTAMACVISLMLTTNDVKLCFVKETQYENCQQQINHIGNVTQLIFALYTKGFLLATFPSSVVAVLNV